MCVEATTPEGPLTCDCPQMTSGAQCENSNPPPFVPSVPPSLHSVPAGGEAQAAIDFTDWYARSSIGDGNAARTELRAARSNPALTKAFVALTTNLIAGPNFRLAAAGLDMVGFLQCRDCEQLLKSMLTRPIPSAGVPTAFEHGTRSGTADEFAELALQQTAINGLAFQMTRSSKSYLLSAIATVRVDVRRSIAHALIAAYGSAVRADVIAALPPEEMIEALRFPNYASNFSALYSAFPPAGQ
jgi:hypothetical protein